VTEKKQTDETQDYIKYRASLMMHTKNNTRANIQRKPYGPVIPAK